MTVFLAFAAQPQRDASLAGPRPRSSESVRLGGHLLVLVFCLAGLIANVSGCGQPASSVESSASSVPPGPSSTAEPGSSTERSRPQPSTSAATAGDLAAAGVAEVEELRELDSSEGLAAAGGNAEAATTAAATEAESPASVPALSEEQSQAWRPPTWDKLQLLDYRLLVEPGILTCLAAMPDGRSFIVAGNDVSLWDIDGERPRAILLEAKPSEADYLIRSLVVAPDGSWVAAGDTAGKLHRWRLPDGQLLEEPLILDNDPVAMAVSPDGRELATISFDQQVTICSLQPLKKLREFAVDTDSLKNIVYVADQRLVVAGQTASLWNTANGERLQPLSSGRYRSSLARTADQRWLLYGEENHLKLWDIARGEVIAHFPDGFAMDERVTFSPDGSKIATANAASLRIWDTASQRLLQIEDTFEPPIVAMAWLPDSEVLLVASATGELRQWGSTATAAKLQRHPLAVVLAAKPASLGRAMTSAELLQTIDLRIFPRLPETIVNLVGESNFDGTAPVRLEEAQLFYRYFLQQAGWREGPANPTMPTSLMFSKDGSLLTATFYGDTGDKTRINLTHVGNVDLRRLPKSEVAPIELTFESPQVVIYRSPAALVSLEVDLLKKLSAAGWVPFSRLNSSYQDTADQRELNFLQQGHELRVSIGRFPTAPEAYTVQYACFLHPHSLPLPTDASYVEFDGSTRPALVASSRQPLAALQDYFDTELTSQGWRPVAKRSKVEEKQGWLAYFRGQQDLRLGLQRTADGRTLVLVGDRPETNSWQWSALVDSPTTAPAATDDGGLEAADFPIPPRAQPARFDPDNRQLECVIPDIGVLQAAEQYTRQLGTLGWIAEEGGLRSEEYTFLTFKKGEAEISWRGRARDGQVVLSVDGDGLRWTKALPIGGKVIAYETWLRRNHQPATLELLDRYQAEMQAAAR
jgi:WD40 repeat protein